MPSKADHLPGPAAILILTKLLMLADAAAGLQVLRVVAFVLVASDLALRLVLFFHYININFMTAYCAYLKNKQKNTERVGHIKNVDEIISFFLFWLWKKRRKVSIIRCYEDNYCKKKQKILVKSIKLSMQCWQKKEKEIRVGENLTTTNLLHQEFF